MPPRRGVLAYITANNTAAHFCEMDIEGDDAIGQNRTFERSAPGQDYPLIGSYAISPPLIARRAASSRYPRFCRVHAYEIANGAPFCSR